jgi:dienelactone hydrolase
LIFYIPGCDTLKEAWPHPFFNAAHQRGMHVFSFDGPGHAESNLRNIRLTANNFEDAASAALDHLVQRPEIDAGQIGVYSISLGSFWGLRFAARDRRIRGIAAPAASCCEKYFLMDLESPRWKQLFAYLTQSKTEAELDAVVGEMTLDGYMDKIACPALLAVGEYDPRGPLDEVYRIFDQVTAPRTGPPPCMARCVTGCATASPTSRCGIPARRCTSRRTALGPIAPRWCSSGSGTRGRKPCKPL